MLTIEVVAIHGAPPPVPMSARFGTDGGSIGRDTACTLALPDAEKRISRRHAQVVWQQGGFRLRNQGSAIAVIVNGAPLDFGSEVTLASGDRIDIGDFALRVKSDSALPTASAVQRPPVSNGDILAGFGQASVDAGDPFGDLIPSTPPSRPVPAPAARVTPPSAPMTGLPHDFDPFGEPPAAPAEPPARTGVRDFSDLVPARTESVDQLFALRGGDPFPPDHPLAAPSAASTPGPVGIDDLLRPGAAAPAARADAPPVQRDDAPEINAQMRLPDSARADPPRPPEPLEAVTTGSGMMLSWDQAGDAGVFEATRTMVIGGNVDRRRGERRKAAATNAAPVQPAASPSLEPTDAARSELAQALLDGLGLDQWPAGDGVDAETMRRIGQLLRVAVQGTIDLLRARATIKSEVQAHMTMIVTRDNNPLKFSPNVEAALVHLLGPAQRGFMSATAAMDDAYRDLVAHQFGFTAGTRAALADVLSRFDPAALEQRLVAKSMLDSLLPANHKAKLWQLFTERFAQISTEAEEDFQRLFGKEFVRAYEAQVANMGLPAKKE